MWALARIIGTGTDQDRYRSAVQGMSGVTSCVASIPSGADGRPANPNRWCVTFFTATSTATVSASADVKLIRTDLTLSSPVSAMTNQQWNSLASSVATGFGFTPTKTGTLRDLLNLCGRVYEPSTFLADGLRTS